MTKGHRKLWRRWILTVMLISWVSINVKAYQNVYLKWAFLVAQMVKKLPAMWETWVWSLGAKDPLKEGMATHSRYSCLEDPRGQRCLVGYSPWGHKELDTSAWLSTAHKNILSSLGYSGEYSLKWLKTLMVMLFSNLHFIRLRWFSPQTIREPRLKEKSRV